MSSAAELKPGRELDALVAEKVMGWTWIANNRRKWFGPSSIIDTDAGDGYGIYRRARDDDELEDAWWLEEKPRFGDCPVVPHYSTDIAAAWEVVEEMSTLGYSVVIDNTAHIWGVRFVREAYVGGDTLPPAICAAALKALENAHPVSAAPSSAEGNA